MEENKQGKFDKIDELLKDTSAENRIKFNSANSGAEKIIAEDSDIKTLFDKPVQEEVQETDAPIRDVDVQPVAEEDEDSGSDPVCIIDETSTTVELTADTGAYQSFSDSAPMRKKAPKEKIKFNALQIVLMCVVGVILLWCVIFTTDHTLAANGRPPFSAGKLRNMRTAVQATRDSATRFSSDLIRATTSLRNVFLYGRTALMTSPTNSRAAHHFSNLKS